MPDGTTALHWAAHWNDVATVDALIRAGANVNAATDIGVTPLWLACSDGGPAIVTSLLKAGANPNTAPPSGESPLMAAARTGRVESVRALLAHGADVHARDASRGQTALMWAAAQRHADVVRALLVAGADVNARSAVRRRLGFVAGNRNGTGHNAEEQRRLSVEFDDGGYTALLFAAQQDDLASAQILVEAGAEVHDTAPAGTQRAGRRRPQRQRARGRVPAEKGADPNADGAGYTALHAAVLRGNPTLVKALLDRGANPNAKLTRPTPARRYGNEWAFGDNLVGATPFYLAAKFGELELMRTLAAAKADPSLPAHDGSTPLMMALDTPTVRAGGVDGFGTDRRDRYGLINDVTPEQLENEALAIAQAAIELGRRRQPGRCERQHRAAPGRDQELQPCDRIPRGEGRPGERQEPRGARRRWRSPMAPPRPARRAGASRAGPRQAAPPLSRQRLRCCGSSAPPTDAQVAPCRGGPSSWSPAARFTGSAW